MILKNKVAETSALLRCLLMFYGRPCFFETILMQRKKKIMASIESYVIL